MRITVLTSSYPRFFGDGTAPFVKSLAESMVKLGHRVSVIAPYDPKVKQVDSAGVHVYRYRYVFPERYHIMGHAQAMEADVKIRPISFLILPLFLLSAFIHLWRIATKTRTDILHVHWVLPNGPVAMLVSKITRIPYILSLHGSDVYFAKKNKLFGWVAGLVLKRASYISACSEDLMNNAISLGAPADNIHLIPWGADPHIFSPSKRSKEFLSKLGLSDEYFIVSALGRLVYKKGFDKLIEAWKDVTNQIDNARLMIGGEGPIRDELIDQSRNLGIADRILFTGRIDWDKVPEFLSSSDMFVLPSVRDHYGNIDGLPTVLLEAMASETPVIASRLGGIPLVIQNGKNGLLVPPGDIPALTHAIRELIIDEHRRIAIKKQARMDVITRHNWLDVAKLFIKLFDKSLRPSKTKTRMGSIYRDEMMRLLGLTKTGDKVLDVGCHDGLFIRDLDSKFKVGVDPEPIKRYPEIMLIKADGVSLPFIDKTFDNVYSLDVIEHIVDDMGFIQSLQRMISPNGKLVLTTPSEDIRIFPSFTMKWVNKKWDHHLRSGYSESTLNKLFKSDEFFSIVQEWNAPAYRFLYFPVRALFALIPGIMKPIIRKLARWDYRYQNGTHGFLIVQIQHRSDTSSIS